MHVLKEVESNRRRNCLQALYTLRWVQVHKCTHTTEDGLITAGGKARGKASHSLYSVKLSLVQFPFTRDFVSWWNNIITSDVVILTQNFSDYKFKTFIPYYQETKNIKKDCILMLTVLGQAI